MAMPDLFLGDRGPLNGQRPIWLSPFRAGAELWGWNQAGKLCDSERGGLISLSRSCLYIEMVAGWLG